MSASYCEISQFPRLQHAGIVINDSRNIRNGDIPKRNYEDEILLMISRIAASSIIIIKVFPSFHETPSECSPVVSNLGKGLTVDKGSATSSVPRDVTDSTANLEYFLG